MIDLKGESGDENISKKRGFLNSFVVIYRKMIIK